jgi:hypothetical protein
MYVSLFFFVPNEISAQELREAIKIAGGSVYFKGALFSR